MTGCGHGHVYPEPGGILARCGGPGICEKCSTDFMTFVKSLPEGQRGDAGIEKALAEMKRMHAK